MYILSGFSQRFLVALVRYNSISYKRRGRSPRCPWPLAFVKDWEIVAIARDARFPARRRSTSLASMPEQDLLHSRCTLNAIHSSESSSLPRRDAQVSIAMRSDRTKQRLTDRRAIARGKDLVAASERIVGPGTPRTVAGAERTWNRALRRQGGNGEGSRCSSFSNTKTTDNVTT